MSAPMDPIYSQLPVVSIYAPGCDLPATAGDAVAALTFCSITGDVQTNGTVTISTTAAGGRAHGVATYTAAPGGTTGLARGNSRVVRVGVGTTGLVAGADVEVAAGGLAAPFAQGSVAVGYAIADAAPGTIGQISLY